MQSLKDADAELRHKRRGCGREYGARSAANQLIGAMGKCVRACACVCVDWLGAEQEIHWSCDRHGCFVIGASRSRCTTPPTRSQDNRLFVGSWDPTRSSLLLHTEALRPC